MPLSATIFAFCLASLLGLALTPLVLWEALRRGLLDRPAPHKLHSDPRPFLGGIALVAAVLLGCAILQLSFDALPVGFSHLWVTLLPAALLVAISGLVDDLRGLRPWQKLLAQGAAIAWLQFQLDLLGLSQSVGPIQEILVVLVASSWFLGVTNGLNLLDGLDGLAAGLVACIGSGFLLIAWQLDAGASALLAALIIGAALGFLRFNAFPARIFMGDTGSLFLGFCLATVGAHLFWTAPSTRLFLALVCIVWVPALDTTFAVGRRLVSGRSIFRPDRGHLHHRLLMSGLHQRWATLCLCGLGALAAVAGSQIALGEHPRSWAAALLLATLPLAGALRIAPGAARQMRAARGNGAKADAVSQDRAA